ncbi:hypothetical protein BpHYR1_024195 [Brachionus plicatilis]|uniref:Uncharacterized protein n=1 Tax=Brachionus plicatilis TaxID=10195 RepID=A0A3M7SIS5_BRAPC|nr:hypothetical protein BpHYR1_024195 [Brachionus plicatilis]
MHHQFPRILKDLVFNENKTELLFAKEKLINSYRKYRAVLGKDLQSFPFYYFYIVYKGFIEINNNNND